MQDIARNTWRRHQVAAELADLRAATAAWLKRRQSNDRDENDHYVGRHETQLAAIKTVLDEAIAALEKHVAALRPEREVEDLYGDARAYSQAVVWLRRFWDYFREKFDQRDDPVLGPVLRAADEVVWSCWREIHRSVRQGDGERRQGPSPLCFFEAEYSPAALSDQPPESLRLGADVAFLTPFAQSLPLALLRLPPWCVREPWWLIFVAHEVGHHVQRELGLIVWFRDAVAAAVESAPGMQPADGTKWRACAEEIFADLFSVAMLGPWAVAGILEVELAPHAEMTRRPRSYPAPVIRLALMRRAADVLAASLGETWPDPLDGMDLAAIAASTPATARDWTLVDRVVAVGLGPLQGCPGDLKSLCALEAGVFASDTGKIAVLASLLPNGVLPARRLESARQIAAASLQAWRQLATQPVASDARNCLEKRVGASLRASAEGGMRAKLGIADPVTGKGADLADLVLRRSRETEPAEET